MLPLNQLQWPNIQMCALVKYKTFRVNFSLFWSIRLKSGSAVTTNLKPILVHTKFRQFCLFCVFSIWWHCGPDWYGPWAAFCPGQNKVTHPQCHLRCPSGLSVGAHPLHLLSAFPGQYHQQAWGILPLLCWWHTTLPEHNPHFSCFPLNIHTHHLLGGDRGVDEAQFS